ncbi:quinone oxidoreductase [Mycena latifolia]|nr:quinone oxidoreductase [Mycena latifolia]
MRAVLIKMGREWRRTCILEERRPVPRADEVLVEIKAFGLNRMDTMQQNGYLPPPAGASPILGVEFAGHIAAMRSDVTQWKVSDEVMGLAAFQALVICGELRPNDNVLVHAGASVQYLCRRTVTATASTQAKLNWFSLSNGATNTANYKSDDFTQVVKQATGNKGDVVIDFVKTSSLAVDGRMTIFTVPSVNLAPLLFKRLRIQGSTLRSRSPAYQTDLIVRFGKEALHHIVGERSPPADFIHILDHNDIQDARREMEAGTVRSQYFPPKTIGKIVAGVN